MLGVPKVCTPGSEALGYTVGYILDLNSELMKSTAFQKDTCLKHD